MCFYRRWFCKSRWGGQKFIMAKVSFKKNNDLNIYFELHMSDGSVIYEDNQPRCWAVICDFIKNNKNLKVTKLTLKKDSQNIILNTPENQLGYFYGKKILRDMIQNKTDEFIGMGYYDGDNVFVKWFNILDFSKCVNEIRTKQNAGFFLLENN